MRGILVGLTMSLLLVLGTASGCARRRAAVGPSTAAPRVLDEVVRERNPSGEYFVIRGTTHVSGWRIGILGSPAVSPDRVGLSLRTELPSDRFHEACPVRVMIDGLVLDELVHERFTAIEGTREHAMFLLLPMVRLAAMSASERVAIRVCDEELRLDRPQRAVLAEVLLRIEEERRWMGAPTEVQDLSAIPADAGAP